MTSVATHHDTKPCQFAVRLPEVPHSRPATTPPTNDAMMPDSVHQIPAVSEKPEAVGLSPVFAASSDDAPMPMPRMFSKSCTTSAATTPAKIAPQETRLRMRVRWSSGTTASTDAPDAG